MMQKRLFTIWTGAMLAAAVFFAGCSDTTDDDRLEQESMAGNIYLRLRMNIAGSGIPDGSRSIARTGEETPETDDENTIHRMDLLVYNIDDAVGEPLLSDVVSLDEAQIKEITSEKGVLVPLYIQNEKRLRIYAAANLTDEMRERFVLGTTPEVSISFPSANDYGSMINKFVPGSNGKAGSTTTGIPMTGQFSISVPESEGGTASATQTDPHTILVDPEKMTEENPLDIETDMTRMVAKMHVLAKAKEYTLDNDSKVIYVSARTATPETEPNEGTDTDDSNRMGWIRLENVRYMPNGINKSTYFFLQPAKGGTTSPWKDLNMEWNKYVSSETDLTNWDTDFCFYNSASLHEENISPNSHFARAEQYDESRLPDAAADNPYREGMYCPENYFDAPDNSLATKLSNDEEGIPMITHVSIAAKLTPKSIVVSADYDAKMDEFVKSYNDDKDKFYTEYGLNEGDFTDDTERWEKIKKDYFTESNGETSGNSSYRTIEVKEEADAVDLLNWSLKFNKLWSRDAVNPEKGKYPDGTFFVYDTKYGSIEQAGAKAETDVKEEGPRYLFLSAGAAIADETGEENPDNIKKYSDPHPGGWGYYYTYLSKESTDGKTSYTASQVTRNTYYLITIENFGTPGSATPRSGGTTSRSGSATSRGEYIRVNTRTVTGTMP